MIRRPPISTRPYTLFPYTTLFRSKSDVTVSAIGKAKSLRGGNLLLTPLVGADGEPYAMAQGSLAVGGLGVEGGDGSQVVVNVPSSGRIPDGATVERMVEIGRAHV